MAGYKFLGKEDVSGKTVLIRVDLNSNAEGGELFPSERIKQHALTLNQLSEKGAKTIVLAHQGRKGEEDCISLQQHADAIKEEIGKELQLLAWDSDYVAAIKQMQPGAIILMENVRFHDNEEKDFTPEEAAKIDWVQKIASCAELFVQDALSVCHRAQPSVVGFSSLPCFVGPVLERELGALAKYEKGERPVLFIFGGAKIKDSLELMGVILTSGKADNVCVGGLLGQLFLKAAGKNLGETEKTFEEKGLNPLIEKAQQLLSSFKDKIILPIDLAVVDEDDERLEITVEELPTDFPIGDIGLETVALFKKQVHKAKLIVFNGPVGMFEKYGLEVATKKVLEAVSKSKAFSIIGGGDTVDALRELEFMPTQFSHVSLGGKALLQYLSGQSLPGLQALQK